MQKKVFCLATNNLHKVEELRFLLSEHVELKTLEDIGCFDEIVETETTLEGNSLLKAQYVYQKFGYNCIADDSGLEVSCLNGQPGVYSARYAGEPTNATNNMAKLLQEMQNCSDRKAQFRTSITLIENGQVQQFEGIVEGKIIASQQGDAGFGYDPLFIPDGYNKTFAQMSADEKNPISHRGKAIQKLIAYLNLA